MVGKSLKLEFKSDWMDAEKNTSDCVTFRKIDLQLAIGIFGCCIHLCFVHETEINHSYLVMVADCMQRKQASNVASW